MRMMRDILSMLDQYVKYLSQVKDFDEYDFFYSFFSILCCQQRQSRLWTFKSSSASTCG